MAKYLLIFLLAASVSLFAQFDTPGTGVNWGMDELVSNSSGTVSGSAGNYTINQLVTVASGDTVTIGDGTTINFTTEDAGFEIDGMFFSNGTEGNENLFTSPTADSSGSWKGLRFNEGSDNSGVYYTEVRYAAYAVRSVGTSIEAKYCHLIKNDRGFTMSNSNTYVGYSTVEQSRQYGINVTLSSSPTIEYCTIFHNNTQNTSPKNQVSVGLQGNNSPIIKYNTIYGYDGQVAGGISIWVYGASSYSNAQIIGNEIYNNSFGITLYSSSNGVVNVLVDSNYVHNNTTNPDVMVAGSGINLYGSPFNTPLIKNNIVTENYWGITMLGGTSLIEGPQPKLGNVENDDPDDDGNNQIYNNLQNGVAYDLYNNATNDVYAQNNDWGTDDPAEIEAHIFHSVDDPAHGTVTFSPFKPTTTPVELATFSAVQVENKVVLNWNTATEQNNDGFEVYRNEVKLGFINGNGTVEEPQQYSFTDAAPVAGENNYQLFQLDYDGTRSLVATQSVNYTPVINSYTLNQNYPNPFNPSTVISFELPEDSHVTLEVYNIIGEKITTLLNSSMEAGSHNVEFSGKNLSSGIYFYTIKTNSPSGKIFSEAKKMILNK